MVNVRSGSLKALLDLYKFDSALEAGTLFSSLLDTRLPILPDSLTLVPVPTTPNHKRIRGFDHTHVIAKRLAKTRNLAYSQLLVRDSSGTQHFLNKAERLNAAKRGLRVTGRVPEKVLLIDDIYTTGATLAACAQLLRANGAKTIYAAVIARQTLDEDEP